MFAVGGVVSIGLLFLFLNLISSGRLENIEKAG